MMNDGSDPTNDSADFDLVKLPDFENYNNHTKTESIYDNIGFKIITPSGETRKLLVWIRLVNDRHSKITSWYTRVNDDYDIPKTDILSFLTSSEIDSFFLNDKLPIYGVIRTIVDVNYILQQCESGFVGSLLKPVFDNIRNRIQKYNNVSEAIVEIFDITDVYSLNFVID